MKNIYIDIDGILTNETDGHDYIKRTPKKGNINIVNRLYKLGHVIILYTARWDIDNLVTRRWLLKYGVKYSKIIYNKPSYDILIDDKAMNTFNCNLIFNLLEEKMKKMNEYHFKGEINLNKLIDDCRIRAKIGFVAIGEKSSVAFVGVLSIARKTCYSLDELDTTRSPLSNCGYQIFTIGKQDISKAILMLNQAQKEIAKKNKKLSKYIYKNKKAGKYSDKPKTKVIVF